MDIAVGIGQYQSNRIWILPCPIRDHDAEFQNCILGPGVPHCKRYATRLGGRGKTQRNGLDNCATACSCVGAISLTNDCCTERKKQDPSTYPKVRLLSHESLDTIGVNFDRSRLAVAGGYTH